MNDEPKQIGTNIPLSASGSENKTCEFCGKPSSGARCHGKLACDECFKNYVDSEDAAVAALEACFSPKGKKTEWYDICPNEYKKPVNYALTDEKAFRAVEAWSYGSKGMIINGHSGRGKTRAIWSLLRRINETEGYSFRFFDGYDFSCASADASRNGRSIDWMRDMINCDLFVFDDLGKNKITPNCEESLFAIIDKRQAAHKPMIFSTQHNRNTLQGLFIDAMTGEAALRRILECCKSIHFSN
jgi:DNA replication protein DnaC